MCVSGAPYTSPPPGLHHAYHTLPGHNLSRPHLVTPRPRLLHPKTTPGVTQLHSFASGWRAERLYDFSHAYRSAPAHYYTYSLTSPHHDHTRPVATHHPPNDPPSPPPAARPTLPSQALSVCCPLQVSDARGKPSFSPSSTAPVRPMGPPLSPPPLIVTRWL